MACHHLCRRRDYFDTGCSTTLWTPAGAFGLLLRIVQTIECDQQPALLHAQYLSPQSKLFFTLHPPQHVGPVQLLFKSVILLSRAMTLLQRLPYPIGTDKQHLINGEAFDPSSVLTRPDFIKLVADAYNFQSSINLQYREALENIQSNIAYWESLKAYA